MAAEAQLIVEQGVLTLSDAAWELAQHRMEVIGPLAVLEIVGHQAADTAAKILGLSRRQVYVLIRRARQSAGLVTDLALGQSSGGKGKGRLPEPVEQIIRALLQKTLLDQAETQLGGVLP